MPKFEKITLGRSDELNRRSFLRASGVAAAATIVGGYSFSAIAQESGRVSARSLVNGRRKLGKLEVSASGLAARISPAPSTQPTRTVPT